MELADLGRKKYVSQSALSTVLGELKALDHVPDATSRSTIKRKREEKMDICTPLGKVFNEISLNKADGSSSLAVHGNFFSGVIYYAHVENHVEHQCYLTFVVILCQCDDCTTATLWGLDLTFVNPAAYIWHLARHCRGFSEYLEEMLRSHPTTQERPWCIAMYSDEISPGNALKALNRRHSLICLNLKFSFWRCMHAAPPTLFAV